MHCNLCTHLLLFWYTYLILKLEVLDDEVGDLEDDIDIVGDIGIGISDINVCLRFNMGNGVCNDIEIDIDVAFVCVVVFVVVVVVVIFVLIMSVGVFAICILVFFVWTFISFIVRL